MDFKMYLVGGCVRDKFLGVKSKDYDYVVVPTEFSAILDIDTYYHQLVTYLKTEGYEIFLETPSCYTIRARFPKDHKLSGQTADFVLARKEIGYKPGTRKPIVVPGTLLDDLSRRDMTINAIAQDIETGEYYDPFNGIQDIKDRILRTPIDGEITFSDDPLRLLRAIRFAVTKEFVISEEIFEIIKNFDYENRFYVVSEERIREELYKCFKFDTNLTWRFLNEFVSLHHYIFSRTKLWLCPTTKT